MFRSVDVIGHIFILECGITYMKQEELEICDRQSSEITDSQFHKMKLIFLVSGVICSVIAFGIFEYGVLVFEGIDYIVNAAFPPNNDNPETNDKEITKALKDAENSLGIPLFPYKKISDPASVTDLIGLLVTRPNGILEKGVGNEPRQLFQVYPGGVYPVNSVFFN